MQNYKDEEVLLDTNWAKIKTKERLCEILVDDFPILRYSDQGNTRGPLVHDVFAMGTVVAVYASKGSPCVHAHSCPPTEKTEFVWVSIQTVHLNPLRIILVYKIGLPYWKLLIRR